MASQVQPDNASTDLMMWILHMQRLQVVDYLLRGCSDLLPGDMILELLHKLLIVWMVTVSQHPCCNSADHINVVATAPKMAAPTSEKRKSSTFLYGFEEFINVQNVRQFMGVDRDDDSNGCAVIKVG